MFTNRGRAGKTGTRHQNEAFWDGQKKSFSSAVQAHRETIQRRSSLMASFSDPSKRALVFLGFSLEAISNAK